MTRKLEWALGASAVVFALACGGRAIKTTQKADGQAPACSYGGKTYNPGDSFRQDCNTCSCDENGQVGCTLMACLTDAGRDLAPDAAHVGAADSIADASPGCTSPTVGALCTAGEVACVACCTDIWTCQDGAWQWRFIGCLPLFFSCGNLTCSEVGSYCEISGSNPTQYACKPLPSACANARCPTCDCLTQAGISFSKCITSATGGIWATQ